MILTVTLNPAVDKTCHIQELMLGQVNRLLSTKSIAGGKGVNVTKILRQFEYPVTAMGFLGGYSGRMIEETLEKMGAVCRFTHIEQETRVSTNILAENGYVTEILEPGPVISKEEWQSFLEEYKKQIQQCEVVVLSGSIPQGISVDCYHTLTSLAKEQGCKVLLDTSGEALKQSVEAAPYLIKPNHKELEFLVGRKLGSKEDFVAEANKLLERGIEKVLISLGAKGLLYVDKQGEIEQSAYKVNAVNTVACGDTVVASFCMSELEGRDRAEAVRCATALSAANATTAVSAEIPMDTYEELLQA